MLACSIRFGYLLALLWYTKPMNIEFEATFSNIDKSAIVAALTKMGATLSRPEFMQKRVVFNLPHGHEIKGGWVRVRDEGDKTTLSLKVVDGEAIENQKEIYLVVNSFEQAELLLTSLGCERKAFQESKRELWQYDGVDITIDEWPYLEPFVEVEGPSEAKVQEVAGLLGLDYDQALFCAVGTLYSRKYGISEDRINNHTPLITFAGENPFI